MAREDLVALKRAIASLRGRIDQLLTAGEKRELLKLISRGAIGNVNELKAYLSRVEAIKSKQQKEGSAKLVVKIIDADTRRPLGDVNVRIQQTAVNEDTDGAGVFIWEHLVKGRTIVLEASRRGYKPIQYQYKSTMDEEQPVCSKLPPLQRRGEPAGGPKKRKPGGS